MAHNTPIDPLRFRLFSELNLQLSHHGIEKEDMHETSKHLAFLCRYYLNSPSPDPLSISVPMIDIPVVSPAGDVAMAHKIALGGKKKTEMDRRIRVLIQTIGTLGHHKCLLGGFSAVAERVISGLLTGEEELVSAAVEGGEAGTKGKGGGRKKNNDGKWKEGGEGKGGAVWDVKTWEEYC